MHDNSAAKAMFSEGVSVRYKLAADQDVFAAHALFN